MSATQHFVMTVTSDGRYANRTQEGDFARMIAGRVHVMDGVHNVDCQAIGHEQVVISRAEYDQLREVWRNR